MHKHTHTHTHTCTFSIICWFGNITKQQLAELSRIEKYAAYIIDDSVVLRHYLSDTHLEKMAKMTTRIMSMNGHYLAPYFVFQKAGVRLQSLKVCTNKFQNYFILQAVMIYNTKRKR